VFGDGEQTRDFVSVKDVVQANLLAAESSASGVFNVGNGDKVSLNDLIRVILMAMNRNDIKPLYEASRPGDIMHSLADISKIESLGYIPKYSIEAGLEELIRSLNPEVLSLS
jgi:UDP-glucose 4-epimerase